MRMSAGETGGAAGAAGMNHAANRRPSSLVIVTSSAGRRKSSGAPGIGRRGGRTANQKLHRLSVRTARATRAAYVAILTGAGIAQPRAPAERPPRKYVL